MESQNPVPYDYTGLLKRRKWSLIFPTLTLFLIAATVAMMLPPIFESTATILIEEQGIPDDFVTATVTSDVEKRLKAMNQQIKSSSTLSGIIDQFRLYEELKEKQSLGEIIGKMRQDIRFETVSAEVLNRRTGKSSQVIIGFKISFQGSSPHKVRQVTEHLASLYLEENLRTRKQQTKETSVFLENEMEKVKRDLADIEKRISI